MKTDTEEKSPTTAAGTVEPKVSNGKRIGKNTIYLYTRTLVMMLVTLYTTRVTIDVLGNEGFGIFNLVAGVVVLFSFLNFAMERATLRFLIYEKGRGDMKQMHRVFCVSVMVHLCIAGVLVLLAETVGLWYVNHWLNVASEMLGVTNVVYQFAVLSTVFNILRIPYNASIIAYERMSFYAAFSVVESVLRLGVVFLLMLATSHQLELYSALWCGITLIVFASYRWFCLRKFSTCRMRIVRDKPLFIRIITFSGWNMLGGMSNLAAQQGIAIIINRFFGVVINASVGITNQVGTALNGVLASFQTAFNPRLVTLYAQERYDELLKMLSTVSKASFYLCCFIVVPLSLNIDFILRFWLGADEVPPFTAQFCVVYMLFYAIDAMSNPLWMTNQATGRIKWFTIIWSVLLLSNLPFCWIAFKCGLSPVAAFWIRTGVNLIIHFYRMIYLHFQIGLPLLRFFTYSFIIPLGLAAGCTYIIILIGSSSAGRAHLFLTTGLFIPLWGAAVYALGLNTNERTFVKSILSKIPGKLPFSKT